MLTRMPLKFVSTLRSFQRVFHGSHVLKSVVEIRMPSLSPTMSAGNIVKWHKSEGDTISPGDLLCEIQTDKTVVGFDIEQEGTLAKILKGDNSKEVTVGTLIALIAEEGTDWKNVEVPVEASDNIPMNKTTNSATKIEVEKTHKSRPLGPVAKILLGQYGIKASNVVGSGPHGILLKSDVLKYIKENNLKPVESSIVPDKDMAIPKKLVVKPSAEVSSSKIETSLPKHSYSKMSVPHSYSSIEVCMDSVQKLCEEFKEENLDVGCLDILIKAAAISLKTFPHMNAIWINDDMKILDTANISFLLDCGDSHAIHQIKDASSSTVEQISAEIKKLKTSSSELQNLESSHSSLLICYLGNVDVTSYHGVVTPPYVSCLTFVTPRFVLDENCSKRLKTTISMSVNCQVISDVDATNFLVNIKEMLETPSLIISQPGYGLDLAKLFAK